MSRTDAHHLTDDDLAAEVWEDESPASSNEIHPHPTLRQTPIGLDATGWRTEQDSLGSLSVPADRYWGAQTERSLEHFPIGAELMPIELVHAYALVKQAAAMANADLGVLPTHKTAAIVAASREVAAGLLDDHFPLSVFQTGSGTHTNANLNEVIANRASQMLGGSVGARSPVHPNDDVNKSQSTNDTFVTALHVASVAMLHDITLPGLDYLLSELAVKADVWSAVRKPGRTHLMDATDLTMGQEWSGYVAAMDAARRHLLSTSGDLYEVALGGTAVGTGINAPAGFDERAISRLAHLTSRPFRPAANAFSAQSTLDAVVRTHGALKGVAVTLFKIANDLRWMGSGPHHGLGELVLPEGEAGSSIMPGKVNPTQAEATLMACIQVFGDDIVVTLAGAEGNFELNAFRPVVANSFLRSARILGDASRCLARFLVHDAELSSQLLEPGDRPDTVAFTTALAAQVGYDRAARIARSATQRCADIQDEAARDGIPQDVITAAFSEARRLRRSA